MSEACWKKIGTEGDGSCERLGEVAHCRNCGEYVRAGRRLLDREIPTEERAEWTRLLAEEPPAAAADVVSVVVFRVGEEWMALPAGVFSGVMESRAVHTVPGRSRGAFLGLVNVDGELLLCFSTARLLGLEWKDSPGRMFVTGKDTDRYAFPAEEVLGIRRVSREAMQNPPATLAHAPAAVSAAIFELEGRQVALIDEAKLFESAARSLE